MIPWSSSKKEMAELFSNSRSSIIDLGWLRVTARAGPESDDVGYARLESAFGILVVVVSFLVVVFPRTRMAELVSPALDTIINLGWQRATARAGPGSGRLRLCETLNCICVCVDCSTTASGTG